MLHPPTDTKSVLRAPQSTSVVSCAAVEPWQSVIASVLDVRPFLTPTLTL